MIVNIYKGQASKCEKFPERLVSASALTIQPTEEICAKEGWYTIAETVGVPDGMIGTEFRYEVIYREESYTETVQVKEGTIEVINPITEEVQTIDNMVDREEERTRQIDTLTCSEICIAWKDPAIEQAAKEQEERDRQAAQEQAAIEQATKDADFSTWSKRERFNVAIFKLLGVKDDALRSEWEKLS
jgi:hypothetical protein